MRKALLSVAGAALVLAACGGGSGGDSGSSATDAQQSEAPAADSAGRLVSLASGGTVDLDSFAGQDVLFWFWAPW